MKKVLAFLIAGVAFTASGYPARVTKVTDGDNCIVMTEDNHKIRIRLAGIDTPERKQDYGPEAKQVLSDKISGKTVEVKERSKDRYGRTVADLYLGERWVNLELVAEGAAWHYKYYSKDKQLAEAEKNARKARLGLWAAENPIPPWEYRRKFPIYLHQPLNQTGESTIHKDLDTPSRRTNRSYWQYSLRLLS